MTDLLDLITARELRDQGMALAEDAEPQAWVRAATACIADLAASGQSFSADDVRLRVGSPRHAAAFGAVFRRAVASGQLVEDGRVQSERVLARGRRLQRYRGLP